MSALQNRSDGDVPTSASVAASAGMGAVAAALGYLLTYLIIADEVRDVIREDVADWKGVAWYFYNGHLVDIQVGGSIGDFGGSGTVDFIAQSGSTNAELLYLIPPIVLVAIGGLLAYHLGTADLGQAVFVGAPIAIGYAVVMVAGALVAEASTEATFVGIEVTGSMAPALLPALILAGIIYPVVFGTVGAMLVTLLATR